MVPEKTDAAERPCARGNPHRRLGSRRRGTGPRTPVGARIDVALRHMIGFRQVDARYPFLWEDRRQPAGRWHRDGDGPAHYFADTPDGAWAEFLRHEEITEPEDVLTIRRQLWAVEIGDAPAAAV